MRALAAQATVEEHGDLYRPQRFLEEARHILSGETSSDGDDGDSNAARSPIWHL